MNLLQAADAPAPLRQSFRAHLQHALSDDDDAAGAVPAHGRVRRTAIP